MKNKKIIKVITNFLLYTVSFLLIYFVKKRGIVFDQFYVKYFGIYIGAWAFSSLVTRKFVKIATKSFSAYIKPNINAFFLMLGILAFISFKVEMIDISRWVLLLSLTISFFVEVLIKTFRYKLKIRSLFKRHLFITLKINSFSTFLFEFLLLTAAIVLMAKYYLPVSPSKNYFIVYAIIYFIWLVSSFYTHQFSVSVKENYFKAIYPHIKSLIFFMSLILFNLFILRLHPKNQVVILESLLIFSSIYFILITFVFIIKHPQKTDEVAIKYFSVNEIKAKTILIDSEEQFQDERHKIASITPAIRSLKEKLSYVYLRKNKKLFEFVNNSLELNSIQLEKSEILKSSDSYNIEIIPDKYLELFVNLHEINDQQQINKYFIKVNEKLQLNGIYIGLFEPIKARYSRYLKKYPYFIAMFFYAFDFIWKRAFPKLPFLQKIYFLLTNGKNRAISKAEGLGRLYYCGFKVIAIKQLDNMLYFIAKKVKEPEKDDNPSYGPIFKMKRIGKDGKKIFVYKFRTMHPYSEYLHGFILRYYGFTKIGKPANDFRVTSWGKLMRKLWLDELPQLINVLKGEMKLVGVRPVSERHFQEFPPEHQKQRVKNKPGCIPPYVSLLMQGVKNGNETKSEIIYLNAKEKHPFFTDIEYFFKAVYNILTNKIRSA